MDAGDINQIIRILESDDGISQATKDRLGKLKSDGNKWQSQLMNKWRNLDIPTFNVAQIRALNDARFRVVQRLNKTRGEVRAYLVNNGQIASAAALEDIEDTTKRGKDSVVRNGKSVLGWHPSYNRWIKVISDANTISIQEFSSCVTLCQFSGALNIPLSLDKLFDEGCLHGLSEDLFKDLLLDFIRVYKSESLLTARNFSRDLNEILNFTISLVNTSAEIEKVRNAIREVARSPTDELVDCVMKLKSLTTSLLFLVNPNAERTTIEKRADAVAKDSIFELVNENVLGALRLFKQRSVETERELTLNSLITEAVRLETLHGKPCTTLKLSDRNMYTDCLNSYFTKKNWQQQKHQDKRYDGRKNNKNDNKGGRDERRDPRRSRSKERQPSRERQTSKEKETRQERRRTPSSDRRRSTSKETFKGNGCWKCGDESHQMSKCRRYPFYCEQKCDFCNLMHPTSFCRFRKSRYNTPPKSREHSRTRSKSESRSREASPSRQNYFLQ